MLSLFWPAMQFVEFAADMAFSWQTRNVNVPASAVVPGGVKPKSFVLTAMRTLSDSGVDSFSTNRKLSLVVL